MEQILDPSAEIKTAATILDFKDITNPDYVGPGTWHVLHSRAYQATTQDEQQVYCQFVRQVCDKFPCTKCRTHFKNYLENHPPEELVTAKVMINKQPYPLGVFYWSWKFHNTVNQRLNKPLMAWETALSLYDNSKKTCGKSCTNTATDQVDGMPLTTVPR